MLWAAVSFDGSKSTLVFIEKGVKVDTQVCIEILAEKDLPWITESFGKRYVLAKVCDPFHKLNVTQQWCQVFFSAGFEINTCGLSQVQTSTQ